MKKILLLLIPFFLLSFKHKEKAHVVEINTKFGKIKVRLYNETPLHRDNFLQKVNTHFYDSLLFHRVIKDFMIQGGDPDSKHAKPGQMLGNGEATGGRIPAEISPDLFHKKGALAMARDNNPEKASSNCQFYIVEGKKFSDADLDRIEKQMNRKIPADQREAYKTIGGTPHLDSGYTVFGEVIEGMAVVDSIAHVKTGTADRPVDDVRITSMKEDKMMKLKKKKAPKT
jgi:cyclophilin family peptidyl-prolyl cis-trans isomerase